MDAAFTNVSLVDIDVDAADKDDATGLWRIPLALDQTPPTRWAKLFDVVRDADDGEHPCESAELTGDQLVVLCHMDDAREAHTYLEGIVGATNQRYRDLLRERGELRLLRDAVYSHAEGQHPREAKHLSGEHQAVLGDVQDHVDQLLDGDDDDDKRRGLATTLQEAARHFGADHPELTRAMDRVLEALSSMGI